MWWWTLSRFPITPSTSRPVGEFRGKPAAAAEATSVPRQSDHAANVAAGGRVFAVKRQPFAVAQFGGEKGDV
jgi:hypothetical protein